MKNDINSGLKIADLIVKRLHGQLTSDEELYLEEWKQEKEENNALFQKLSQDPEQGYKDRANRLSNINKEAGWQRIEVETKQNKLRKLRLKSMQIAAILILALGLSYLFTLISDRNNAVIEPGKFQAVLITGNGEEYQLSESIHLTEENVLISNNTKELVYKKQSNKSKKSQLTYNTIVIPRGGEYKLTLMDGTKIWLNSNSKLRYPSEFGTGERKVELEGEGYFKVAKDSVHPFVVDLNKAQVKVLGTSFNVNAYSDLNEIVTTLVEGKVEVSDELFGNKQRIIPNEQIYFNRLTGETVKKEVDTHVFTAWKDGRFVFENEKLEDIMTRLSRWYDVDVVFVNDDARNLRFSGDLNRYENINQILEMIEVTQKVKFEIKNRNLLVEQV